MRGLRRFGLFVASISLCAASRAAPPTDRNPFIAASAQVQARFTIISNEADRLQTNGQIAQANAMRAQLSYFQSEYNGTLPSGNAGSPELDVVGLYQGLGGGIANGPPGTATVHVAATDRPVVLGISAYSSVKWTVTADPGVNLQQIIVSGYEPGQLVSAPDGVPVTNNSGSGNGKDYLAYAIDYREYVTGMRSMMSLGGGAQPVSFRGLYEATSAAFEVGPSNPDWRAQRVLHEMQGLYDQATAYPFGLYKTASQSVRFNGLANQFHPDYPSLIERSDYTQFSVNGPVDGTAKPLNNHFNNFVLASGGQVGYGQDFGSVYRVTMPDGQATPLDLSTSGNPQLSNPCGVAYDTQRNRMILATLGGTGFLYSYLDQPQQWFQLGNLQNVDLQSITYMPADDSIYGLVANNSSQSSPGIYKIRKYSSITGNLLNEFAINEIVGGTGQNGPEGMQLLTAGNLLALLTPPTPDLYRLDQPDAYRLFLIDRSTGDVSYFGPIPVPEPATAGTLAAALGSFLLVGRRRRG